MREIDGQDASILYFLAYCNDKKYKLKYFKMLKTELGKSIGRALMGSKKEDTSCINTARAIKGHVKQYNKELKSRRYLKYTKVK